MHKKALSIPSFAWGPEYFLLWRITQKALKLVEGINRVACVLRPLPHGYIIPLIWHLDGRYTRMILCTLSRFVVIFCISFSSHLIVYYPGGQKTAPFPSRRRSQRLIVSSMSLWVHEIPSSDQAQLLDQPALGTSLNGLFVPHDPHMQRCRPLSR